MRRFITICCMFAIVGGLAFGVGTREGDTAQSEEAALEELRKGLTAMVRRQAQTKKEIVQETGRQQIEQFVRTWLLQSFTDAEEVQIEVVFANELDRARRISIAE